MNKLFYPKLAASNMKKNSKVYIPYLLSCAGSVVMFYIINALSASKWINQITGGAQMKQILFLGSFVIALFAAIFLFYTNSFLIKRRKKEFGLLNILGMEKRHISKIMFYETLYTAAASIASGLLIGFLLNKLMALALLKIMHLKVQSGFGISGPAVTVVLILFGAIFALTYLNTLRQIHLSKPIDLLKGGQTGEKEPRTKWLLTLIGVACLGSGYYIALTTESPLSALFNFFIAVILVICGTYALFISGSIALLKLLRRKKSYYYNPRHFISVSGMIYRMKQNAVGLSNICILSTVVLVMLSTTFSLYIGMEDVLRTRYVRNIAVEAENVTEKQAQLLDGIIQKESEKLGVTPANTIRYRSVFLDFLQDGDTFTAGGDSNSVTSIDKMSALILIPLSEYNRMTGQNRTLADNEIMVYPVRGGIEGDTFTICGRKFQIRETLKEMNVDGKTGAYLMQSYYVVMPDIKTIGTIYQAATGKTMGNLSYWYGFDVKSGRKTQIALTQAISKHLKATGLDAYSEGAEASRQSFYIIYGGLLFLGIFLGLLFVMATVLIIYYKQISEGYDDRERFDIMQKVGMSHDEVKKSIRSQVLTVFFLPLIAACVHIAFAFKVITKLLAVLNLTNVPLFALCTAGAIVVFAAFYAAVYALTAKSYYAIVK